MKIIYIYANIYLLIIRKEHNIKFNLLNLIYKKIMNIINPKFEISAVSPKQYPKNNLPEIVLVGKSNVGKSSFINTMINRKKLARTSSEPR